jgi:hypothetical protein
VILPPDSWEVGGIGPLKANIVHVDSLGNSYYTSRVYRNSYPKIYNFDGTLYGVATMPTAGIPEVYIYAEYLVKYNSSGFVQWVVYITGQSTDCFLQNITSDSSGNPYLSLKTEGAAFFDSSGAAANLFNASLAVYNIKGMLVKLNSTGFFQWVALVGTYPNYPNDQAATWVADARVAPNGDVYMCGTLHGALGRGIYTSMTWGFFNPLSTTPAYTINTPAFVTSAFIAKVNSSGNFQWAAQMTTNPITAASFATCIELDTTSNVATVFGSYSASGFTAYSSTGAPFGTTLSLDSGTTYNGFAVRYSNVSSNVGAVTSVTKLFSAETIEIINSIRTSSGFFYISGVSKVSGVFRIFLAKLDSSLAFVWTAYSYGNGTQDAMCPRMAIDSSGNVYLAAAFKTPAFSVYHSNAQPFTTFTNTPDQFPYTDFSDTFLAKYNTNGAVQWALQIGGDRDEFPRGLAVRASGDLLLDLFYRTSSLKVFGTQGQLVGGIGKSESTGEVSGGSYYAVMTFSSDGFYKSMINAEIGYDNRFVSSSGNDIVGLEIVNNYGTAFFQGLRKYYFIQGESYTNLNRPSIFSFDPISTNFTFNASILVEYAYLGTDELKWFKNSRHNFLLEQKQVYKTALPVGKTALPLQFVGPVTDLWVTAKTDSNANTYTYSNITSMALTLNSAEMFNYNGVLFNLVTPFEVADNFPSRNVFMYRFGAPANFSRVRDKVLTVEVAQAVNVQVWARTFNVLVVQNGMGGLLFNSYT